MAIKEKTKTLEEIILEDKLLTPARLKEALAETKRAHKSLPRILVENGFLTESSLMAVFAKQVGMEFIDLSEVQVDPSVAGLISEAMAKRYKVLPVRIEDGKLVVAMSDPANIMALDDIRTLTGKEVKPALANAADILTAISRLQSLDRSVEEIGGDADDSPEEGLEIGLAGTAEEAPIVRLVNLIITQAVNDRASDIHVEPQEKEVRVRFRIDGVLHDVLRQPKKNQAGVISRLKIMADMDIADRRIPQDGRISLVVQKKAIDIRVASLPTVWGEKLVLRILDKSSVLLKLEDLGLSDANFKKFESSFIKPYGLILVTGPTGSGKSTTLYATLNILNQADRNIITVEDPVEYRLAGVNQVQTNNRAGLTFASALRSMLRADPDIILVGEIRDRETAQIAIEASLTGHLVLSTLHTNDAPSAIGRLIEMGVEPFLVASSTDAIVAQRLARKLCPKCKQAYTPTLQALQENSVPLSEGESIPTFFRPVGCQKCGKTGYRGRTSVHEIMPMSEEIERLTVERRSTDEIRAMAREQGMLTLRQDGIQKVRDGVTSLEEIQRVVV
ncbi:MAG: GspE/PulE family protein [Actinomycetota bacterium]